jgi:RNA polymerase sigma factor (sigma-70 family)
MKNPRGYGPGELMVLAAKHVRRMNIRNGHLAEDATQDYVTAAYAAGFRTDGSGTKSYQQRAGTWAASGRVRKSARLARREREDVVELDRSAGEDASGNEAVGRYAHICGQKTISPAASARRGEIARALRQAIRARSLREQRLLHAHFRRGLNSRQAAAELRMPYSSVRRLLRKLLDDLRRLAGTDEEEFFRYF